MTGKNRRWKRIRVSGVLALFCGAVRIGTLAGGETPPQDGKAAKEAPRVEHLAWCPMAWMHMDGPRLEAMSAGRPGAGLSDEAGNVYFGTRVLDSRSGIITTIADDYWQTDFGVDEGPISAFSSYEPYPIDSATFCRWVGGTPLEGGDKGCLYFGEFNRGEVKKVWKSPDQDNRWWFRKIAGGGKTKLPQAKGGTVPAREADLRGRMMLQVMPDDRLIVFANGGFYEHRGANLVCLLGPADYQDGGIPKTKGGRTDTPGQGVLGVDGTFYLGTYFGSGFSGKSPAVWRLPPGGKLEPYVHGKIGNGRDGPGLQTGYFCGPHFWAYMHNYKFIPDGVLMLCAHDDAWLRRAMNGRVSTLCKDGEWRELEHGTFEKEASPWFRWMRGNMTSVPGPNGTAVVPLCKICDDIVFQVSGIDWTKPVTGPQLGDLPPNASSKGKGGKGTKQEEGK